MGDKSVQHRDMTPKCRTAAIHDFTVSVRLGCLVEIRAKSRDVSRETLPANVPKVRHIQAY
jgi:hypothetical protein